LALECAKSVHLAIDKCQLLQNIHFAY
jgi:hypothetical protein